MEVKEIRFDRKGNYKRHAYRDVEKGDSLYSYINKKPGKTWNADTQELEFVYITDDLNTSPESIADKYIKEKHRLFFYVLDPAKKEVEIEFSKNMESFIDTWLIKRKLKGYKCIHKLRDENEMFEFGSDTNSFDKIYFITDEINDDLAKATLYDELKIQHVEIMNELKFIERMMEISGGAKIVTEEKKPDIASMIAQIDADGDIEIEEYVVEKNIFFSSVKEFFTDIKGLFRKGNKNECI